MFNLAARDADVRGKGEPGLHDVGAVSAGGTWSVYKCKVKRTADGWTLIDLATDR